MNDLISKNKIIQNDCKLMGNIIDEAKKKVFVIIERLNSIINDEISKELL